MIISPLLPRQKPPPFWAPFSGYLRHEVAEVDVGGDLHHALIKCCLYIVRPVLWIPFSLILLFESH